MKKKVLALICAMTMVVSVFAGCGQQDGEKDDLIQSGVENGTEQSLQTSSEEKKVELEPYTVTYWMNGEESKDNEKVMELVNEKIQEVLPNTTLDIVWVASSEYKDRWNKALAAGEKIDIGWSASWVNSPAEDVANGMLLPVEDLLKEYGQGIVDAVGGWEILDLNHSADDQLYHILAWQGLVGNRRGLYIKQEVADLMPEGWLEESEKIFMANNDFDAEDKLAIFDRIEEVLEAADENGMLENGVIKSGMSRTQLIGTEYCDYKLCVVEEDGVFTVLPWVDNEVYKAYSDKLNEWYLKGYYRSDVLSADATDDGSYILYVENAVSSNYAEARSSSVGYALTGCLLEENNRLIQGFDTGVVIPVTSENPERAMQVLNLIYTDAEIYQLLVYGIEGEHYTTNADGTITRPASEDRTYAGISNWTLGTCMNSLAESADKIGYYDALREEQATATASPLLGFSFDKTNVATEDANLSAVLSEYDWLFLTDNWEVKYEEYVEKLYDAGLETYMEEFKKQLTEFVEAKGVGTVAP